MEDEKESLIKANIEIKSTFEAKEDAIMTKWREIFISNANEVCALESTSKVALEAI